MCVCVCVCVCVCDLETCTMWRARPELGCCAKGKIHVIEIWELDLH